MVSHERSAVKTLRHPEQIRQLQRKWTRQSKNNADGFDATLPALSTNYHRPHPSYREMNAVLHELQSLWHAPLMDLDSKSAHAGVFVCSPAYGDNPAVNDIISWSLNWQKLDIPFGRPLRMCDTGSAELIPGITAERKQLALVMHKHTGSGNLFSGYWWKQPHASTVWSGCTKKRF